ncbi:MAG: RNA-binding S4 domain-containing protein [Prevotellaceae bacterium]|jgi:ribosome-associated heat shock protein Hsp15|nr:RNA-binding S4 domain-containing protein [Prevotellaceae bacterium]
MESVRIDKYLWTMRLFKTRNEAADACKANKVKVNNTEAKASRTVKIGDSIELRKSPVVYIYKVIGLIDNRQPAKNVSLYIENHTSAEELAKLEHRNLTVFIQRDKGAGRPTKKERRELEQLIINNECYLGKFL